jgi:histidine triad (HIT) family protein
VVFRDADVVEFFPTDPATLGHTLVVPTRHVEILTDLFPHEASMLSLAVLRLSQAVGAAFSPDGLNVIQSNGSVAEQTVRHVHFHVVPRWAGDAIGPIWPAETSFAESSKDNALNRLRAALAS